MGIIRARSSTRHVEKPFIDLRPRITWWEKFFFPAIYEYFWVKLIKPIQITQFTEDGTLRLDRPCGCWVIYGPDSKVQGMHMKTGEPWSTDTIGLCLAAAQNQKLPVNVIEGRGAPEGML